MSRERGRSFGRACCCVLLLFFVCIATHTAPAQWQEESCLFTATDSARTAYCNSKNLVAQGDYVHMTWSDKESGKWRSLYRRSTDGGDTWDDVVPLSDANSDLYRQDACIAVEGSNVYVVWMDRRTGKYQLFLRTSTDNGGSWSDDHCIKIDTGDCMFPAIAVDGSTLHVAYTEIQRYTRGAYYMRSTDGGRRWLHDIQMNEGYFAECGSVVLEGDVLHVCWYDYSYGNSEIMYRRSTDGGVSWSERMRLSDDPGVSNGSTLAASGNDVHVFWHDLRTGVWDVHYVYSWDGGLHWGEDEPIMVTPYDCYFPTVAISGQTVHLAWVDKRSDEGDIYYCRSDDGGLSWSVEQPITSSSRRSRFPFLSVSGSVLHALWMDDYKEIFYRRDPTGNPVTTAAETRAAPAGYSLEQNHPNPFAARSAVRFTLPGSSSVRITVHDLLGNTLQTIVDDQRAAGTYTALIDGAALSSGMYLCRMIAGEVVLNRMMTVLKR